MGNIKNYKQKFKKCMMTSFLVGSIGLAFTIGRLEKSYDSHVQYNKTIDSIYKNDEYKEFVKKQLQKSLDEGKIDLADFYSSLNELDSTQEKEEYAEKYATEEQKETLDKLKKSQKLNALASLGGIATSLGAVLAGESAFEKYEEEKRKRKYLKKQRELEMSQEDDDLEM